MCVSWSFLKQLHLLQIKLDLKFLEPNLRVLQFGGMLSAADLNAEVSVFSTELNTVL